MKQHTQNFFDSLMAEALREYTKERFLSDEEAEELSGHLKEALNNHLRSESFDDFTISLKFDYIP